MSGKYDRLCILCLGSANKLCISGFYICVFFQAEDGIRDLVRSRGLGDVYKRQPTPLLKMLSCGERGGFSMVPFSAGSRPRPRPSKPCLLYTSDAADERSSVDLGGRRIIKKKKQETTTERGSCNNRDTPLRHHRNAEQIQKRQEKETDST